MTATEDRDVVVVGSGLAGLGAAHELGVAGYSPLVLEAEPVAGGRIDTREWRDALVECGAVFLAEGYPALLSLIGELGLADAVAATSGGYNSGIRRGGRWHDLDYGRARSALTFSGLGWRDKLSVARGALPALLLGTPGDLGDMAPLARLDTRSVADALSRDAVDYFADGPFEFLWGIRPERASYAMLGLQIRVFRGRMLDLSSGLSSVVDRLAERTEVRCATPVTRVEDHDDHVLVHAREDGGERTFRARAVILATRAPQADAVWADPPLAASDFLPRVGYSRIDAVYLRLRARGARSDHGGAPIGMELVSPPERGDRMLGGVIYADDRAAHGGVLLAVAAPGGEGALLDDEALAERLSREVEEMFPDLRGEIVDRLVVRHDHFTPNFEPGYVKRLAAFRATLGRSRVDLAGDYLYAPWLEGALRSGAGAARRTDAYLRSSRARTAARR